MVQDREYAAPTICSVGRAGGKTETLIAPRSTNKPPLLALAYVWHKIVDGPHGMHPEVMRSAFPIATTHADVLRRINTQLQEPQIEERSRAGKSSLPAVH